MGENPCSFNVGDFIRSVYTGEIFRVVKFYGANNGMCLLQNIRRRATENWNACNNPHFERIKEIPLSILTTII